MSLAHMQLKFGPVNEIFKQRKMSILARSFNFVMADKTAKQL